MPRRTCAQSVQAASQLSLCAFLWPACASARPSSMAIVHLAFRLVGFYNCPEDKTKALIPTWRTRASSASWYHHHSPPRSRIATSRGSPALMLPVEPPRVNGRDPKKRLLSRLSAARRPAQGCRPRAQRRRSQPARRSLCVEALAGCPPHSLCDFSLEEL